MSHVDGIGMEGWRGLRGQGGVKSTYCAKKPPEQGAVSVGLPSQAAAEGALLQLRNLNFLPLEQVGLHPDHSPHSAQVLAPPAEKKKTEEIDNFLLDELSLSKSNLTSMEPSQLGRHRRHQPRAHWRSGGT